MKQHIVMSKKTGELGLMIKLVLFDNPDEEVIEKQGLGKIVWLPNTPDFAGLVQEDTGACFLFPYKLSTEFVEIICEL